MLIRIDDDPRFAHGMMQRYRPLKDGLIRLLLEGETDELIEKLGNCCKSKSPKKFEKIAGYLREEFDYSLDTPCFGGATPWRFHIIDGMHRSIFVYLLGAPTVVNYTGPSVPALHFAEKTIDFYTAEVRECAAKLLCNRSATNMNTDA